MGSNSMTPDVLAHLEPEALNRAIAAAEACQIAQWGTLDIIVIRHPDGRRVLPVEAHLSVEEGLIGDRWVSGKAKPGDQVSMMNLDVAGAIANGQHPALFGDNLFTRLDLSESQLPPGTRLRVGEAMLEISARPHMPCDRFRARFGAASFERTAKQPRLRGVYLTVIEGGSIALGDPIRRA
jgi:MOSC domain-containing protein YiiM